MFDLIRVRYTFHCPRQPEGGLQRVPLSAFRQLQRLPGAAHPAVFRVAYRCACGDDHVGLVAHNDLDYAPFAGLGEDDVAFHNLLTGRSESVADELVEILRIEVQRGNWPWRLYCCRESKLKPVFPSAIRMVAPAPQGGGELVGVAMRCPSCGQVSLNLVSEEHLNVPFYHDKVVRFLDRPFGDGRDLTVERFHSELYSGRFDSERAGLG
jgi:hypothetical protein